eukprot:TRINITY_DN19020_c0_g1_i1.p1 TRINITY_DN19020_c0_g1~~TRINITY_DN19020_c0_g1_i1.p1  ORF type:complete len:107 (+),score=27.57 TRINITY_DN19020_c0_g1_i1:36-356(+)
MGASSSSQSTNLHQFESDQTPLATIGIVEEYIYNRLLVECGPWNSWHRHFRLVCKEWSELKPVSYTHLRAHETPEHLVCRLLLEKKKKKQTHMTYVQNNKHKIVSK